jgi:hypothetical protein
VDKTARQAYVTFDAVKEGFLGWEIFDQPQKAFELVKGYYAAPPSEATVSQNLFDAKRVRAR